MNSTRNSPVLAIIAIFLTVMGYMVVFTAIAAAIFGLAMALTG